MQKIGFALDVDDGWPPVAVEHVWCEKAGLIYELKNAPFFIKGLAFGDKFSAEPDSVNGYVFDFTVVESSGHSLVWALDAGDLKFGEHTSEILALGCSIEGFPAFGLHAIDVPPSVEPRNASDALSKLEGLGFPLAFPVWNHEKNDA
jgi:hypothetical protein